MIRPRSDHQPKKLDKKPRRERVKMRGSGIRELELRCGRRVSRNSGA